MNWKPEMRTRSGLRVKTRPHPSDPRLIYCKIPHHQIEDYYFTPYEWAVIRRHGKYQDERDTHDMDIVGPWTPEGNGGRAA